MATESPQQRYVQFLMARVQRDNFPSGSDLDRIEQFITTADELGNYLDYLFQQVERSSHPSSQMMNRLERLLALATPR